MKVDTELSKIPGIGPKFLTRLQKLKIQTVSELLRHFPFRYDDYSKIAPIAELKINEPATIQGVVKKISLRRTWRRHMTIVEALIADDSGGIKAVWFNQPYITQILKVGTQANFAGKIISSDRDTYLSNPTYEVTSSNSFAGSSSGPKHTAGLIPVYPETKGLTSKGLRFLIKPILKSLEHIDDFVPENILKLQRLSDVNIAIRKIHFPLTMAEAENASRRFAFEDLFLLQLNNIKIKSRLAQEKAMNLEIQPEIIAQLIQQLPFQLTAAQKQSLQEIIADLQRPHPMNRLLQGDVGSGKTVIAAIAALLTARNNLQTAFMAPTEVLASQHYRTLVKIFPHFDGGIALLTANHSEVYYGSALATKMTKAKLTNEIARGTIRIILGTHAIIQKGVRFPKLALAIVDEQHRFGVHQRATLLSTETGYLPHFLSMSATPIPRTLSLTVFGDLDLSTITELPAGRKEIITKIVAPENRQKAYQFIREQIQKGRQAFVICPRIEPGAIKEGEVLTDAKRKALELKSVKEEFEKLSTQIFPELKIVMLHGKMKGKEKDQIMRDFLDKKYDVLVSTSVIEVGVDVPNSTIMMIEGAERFGLAQLYQFRGRVGRGEHQSFCLLFTTTDSGTASERLNFLITAKNGFELAEKDLQLRGPGQFLGETQTGLPDIAMNALKDMELVKAARDAAKEIFSNDPELNQHLLLKQKFERFQKAIHLE